MAIKTIRVFQEFTSAGYVPMPVAGNIDYGVTIANTFPATTPTTFQTDDPDIDVTLTATTDYYVWIRSHGTDWNPMYTRNVRVYPDSPLINNVVMGLIIANLDGTVPYTGATTNVNLGEHGLTTGYLNFDLTPSATPTTASTISWNEGNGTLQMVTLGGNVVHQIGQELLARAFNAETTTLNKGEIVYIFGAQGNRISVKRASSTLETTSSVTIGVVAETIPSGNEGFIMSQGTLGKLDTSALSQGTALWLGTTPGTYTSVKPVAPINSVLIGYVERVHATVGSIYVKIQNGYELEELHNVLITSVANKNTLVYDSTAQVWKNRNIFGTQGYMPYYDDTLLMKDSVIFTNGTNVGISSTSLTEKLVVGGNILATAFKKVGGLSTEFLKADGSSDATAYQPLSADLTAIDNLALTTGLLRKNGSDNWELDQTEYLSVAIAGSTYQTLANLSSNLTASTTKYPSVNAVNAGLALKLNLTGGTLTGGLTLNYSYPNIALSDVSSGTTWNIQNDGSTFKLNYGATNNFYIFSSGNAAFVNSLTASSLIKSGGTSTQFLKADGSVDNTNYQPYDADLASIAGLELTTGLLRKNGLNTYTLDQTEYVALSTANSTYQTLANLQSNLNASSTKYPSVNAVNTGLNLKLNLAGGTLTGDLALAYSYPNIQLSDTSSGTIWNIQNDGGGLEFNSGTTNKFVMYSSGNGTFVNDLTANKFIKSGGTSSQFLMADGSVSSGNAGTVTSVGLSAPTGFSVSGSPVTTSGTLALAFSAGYSLPTISSQGNWDTAYNRSLTSIGVSGTTTKTLTLTKQDGSTLTASWSDINTDAVTSVFGRTGAIVATSGDYTTAQVTESGNLYYTDARARASISGGTGISYNSTTGVITNTITQYTDALARASLSFVAGSGAYNSTTGVITIPTNTSQLTNGAGYITGITSGMVTTALGYTPVTNARTLTINGTTYDLSADRSWTISGTIGGLTSGFIPKATSASTLGNSLIYDNGTNVGINTTSPTFKLETIVSAGVYNGAVSLQTDIGGGIGITGSTSGTNSRVGIFFRGNDTIGGAIAVARENPASDWRTYMAFYTNNSTGVNILSVQEKMRLSSDGNLLVGTTSSAGYLIQANGSIASTNSTVGQLLSVSGTRSIAIQSYSVDWNYLRSNGANFVLGTQDASNFYLRTNDVDRLTIASSGAATFSSSVTAGGIISSATEYRLNNQSYSRVATLDSGGGFGGGYNFNWSNGSPIHDSTGALVGYGYASDGSFRFYTNSSQTANTAASERMRLTSAGNLGLGTTSPATKLEISQSTDNTDGPTLRISNNANTLSNGQLIGAIDFYNGDDSGTGNAVGAYIRSYMSDGVLPTSSQYLSFATGGTTERMRITSTGNLGLGVTPSAWDTLWTAQQFGQAGSLFAYKSGSNYTVLSNNSYAVGGGYQSGDARYINTGLSTAYIQNNSGQHLWMIAPSGTAGLAISFTQAMTLDASGRLAVGNTSPNARISASSSGRIIEAIYTAASNGNALRIDQQYAGGSNFTDFSLIYVINKGSNPYLTFNNGTSDIFSIANSGAATFSSSVSATSFAAASSGTEQAILGGGYLQFYNAAASNKWIKLTDDSSTVNAIGFSKSGSVATTWFPSGNVGIGVANPITPLDVNGAIATAAPLISHQSSRGIFEYNANKVAIRAYGSTAGSGFLAFNVGGGAGSPDSEAMRITSTGLVGIGTTSPNAIIDAYTIQGGSRIAASHGTGGTYPKVSGISFGATSTSLSVSNNGGTTTFIGGAGMYANNTAASNNPTELIFWTTAAGSPTERLRITSEGNVGIGTTTIRNNGAGQTAMQITGTSFPLLSLNGTSNSVGVNTGINSVGGYIGTYTNHAFTFTTSDTERMRITSGGSVLIGTTSDSGYKLDVVGQGRFSGTSSILWLENTTATTGKTWRFSSSSNGNLFITQNGVVDALTFTVGTGAGTFASSVTATSFFESSDKTIKTLITDNYLVKGIESITAKLYTKHGKEELGYFAQDVQGILPSAVSKSSDGLLNLSYREVLVAKVQSLEQRVKELETQLNLG